MDKDIIDILMDKDNRDPISLQDEHGKTTSFEQIAVIPYNQRMYCVLKPLDKMEGIAEDEAVVFVMDTDKSGRGVLRVEDDEMIAIDVFNLYYDLLEEYARGHK